MSRWSQDLSTHGLGATADRNFFQGIAALPHGVVDRPTVHYSVRPGNKLHILRSGGEPPQA
jgi:hypothetical protein